MRACPRRGCPKGGALQPAAAFRSVRHPGRPTAHCATCRRAGERRNARYVHSTRRVGLLARETKRSRFQARITELARQLRIERAARVALANELAVVTARLGTAVHP